VKGKTIGKRVKRRNNYIEIDQFICMEDVTLEALKTW